MILPIYKNETITCIYQDGVRYCEDRKIDPKMFSISLILLVSWIVAFTWSLLMAYRSKNNLWYVLAVLVGITPIVAYIVGLYLR